MSWFTFISVSYVSTCVCTTSFHVYTDCPPPLLPADNLVSLGPGCRCGMEHSHALKTSGRHCGQCWGTLRNYESFCLFSGRWRHLTCFWFFLAELPLVLFQRTFQRHYPSMKSTSVPLLSLLVSLGSLLPCFCQSCCHP